MRNVECVEVHPASSVEERVEVGATVFVEAHELAVHVLYGVVRTHLSEFRRRRPTSVPPGARRDG